MFGKGIRVFKLFGFEVRIDASWLLLAVLVILSLTGGYFPFRYENLGTWQYVIMGIVGSIGLFASIVFHELSHSLVARRFGTPMKGITLFIFGGVAQMEEESRSPKAEFYMAIAGPIPSLVIAGACYALTAAAEAAAAPVLVTGVLRYLAWINMIVAFFNLLPAFPMDGGRVLRAILWGRTKDVRRATRIASKIGGAFGIVLIILGIFSLLAGNLVGGLWWCLIGIFLRSIAQSSYRQVLVRETLMGEPVRRFMKEDPITVSRNVTVKDLVENYMYRHHYQMFPVVTDGELEGCVTTEEVKSVPRSEWDTTRVADLVMDCSECNTIGPQTDATEALAAMSKSGNTRLMVVENGKLLGVVVLKDLFSFLAMKLELEGIDNAFRHGRHFTGRMNDL